MDTFHAVPTAASLYITLSLLFLLFRLFWRGWVILPPLVKSLSSVYTSLHNY